MKTNYKKCEITKTSTTTDVYKTAFGRRYQTIGYVYEISGRINKPAGRRPFLTSVADCKDFINNN